MRSAAAAVQALLEAAVVAEDLLVEAVEVLRVARLVDLLGREERLLVLVVVGHDEAENCVVTRSSPTKKPARPHDALVAHAGPSPPSRGGPG